MPVKEVIGIVAFALGFVGYAPYFRSVAKGRTKPHAFSWIIWSFLSLIAFLAQMSRGAGPGAWPTLGTFILCFLVALCGFWRGERDITRSDWASFIAALAVVPIWYATKDPLGAVIWIAVIEVIGLYPTLRKSWAKPHEESIWPYAGDAAKYALSLLALGHYSAVTMLPPLAVVATDGFFVAFNLWRRLRKSPPPGSC